MKVTKIEYNCLSEKLIGGNGLINNVWVLGSNE